MPIVYDPECCCGDICTEFYCSRDIPEEFFTDKFYVVHYWDDEDCDREDNFIFTDSREEAEKIAREKMSEGYHAEIARGDDNRLEFLKFYARPASEIIKDMIIQAIDTLKYDERRFRPKPKTVKHVVYLVDGSGSMEPAWNEAWSSLFELLKRANSFSILLFKQPRYLTEEESQAIILTDEKYYAIIDVARLLRKKNLVKIKKVPTPEYLGVRFRGRTPLLASIAETIMMAREEYPNAELEIVVVSDNRDSLVHNEDYKYSDSSILSRKYEMNVKVLLLPVGNTLNKYLDKYDKVLAQPKINNVLNLI